MVIRCRPISCPHLAALQRKRYCSRFFSFKVLQTSFANDDHGSDPWSFYIKVMGTEVRSCSRTIKAHGPSCVLLKLPLPFPTNQGSCRYSYNDFVENRSPDPNLKTPKYSSNFDVLRYLKTGSTLFILIPTPPIRMLSFSALCLHRRFFSFHVHSKCGFTVASSIVTCLSALRRIILGTRSLASPNILSNVASSKVLTQNFRRWWW